MTDPSLFVCAAVSGWNAEAAVTMQRFHCAGRCTAALHPDKNDAKEGRRSGRFGLMLKSRTAMVHCKWELSALKRDQPARFFFQRKQAF